MESSMSFMQLISKFASATLWLAAAAIVVLGQAAIQTSELKLNEPLDRELLRGQAHDYQVTLKSGEFMQVRVEQKGIEVVLSIHSADGTKLANTDSPNRNRGFRILSLIADKDGKYFVRVKTPEKSMQSQSGKYSITMAAKRLAKVTKRKNFDAEGRPGANPNSPKLTVPTGHSFGINALDFSADGKILASGASPNTVKLWDVATGNEIKTLRAPSNDANSIAFSPDGKVLVTGGDANTVILWDIATGNQVKTLRGHARSVTSFAFSPDGKILASGGYDHTIKLWDVETGKMLSTIKEVPCCAFAIAFSPDGRSLAGEGGNNAAKLWDVATGNEIKIFKDEINPIKSLAFSPDGKTLAVGGSGRPERGWSGIVELWDVATVRKLKTLKGITLFRAQVIFSPDGKILAGTGGVGVKLWDVATGNELETLKGHDNVTSVAFSHDGKTLASGASFDQTIKLWDVSTRREFKILKGHSRYVAAVVLSPDGKILASGGFDQTVKLWDLVTGTKLKTLKGHSSYVVSLAFSPDGYTLASGDIHENIKLWDVSTARELKTLTAASHGGHAIAFSPDGKTLASGGYVSVKFWDVASGNELNKIEDIPCCVNAISFSPFGKILAGGGINNGIIKLWDVQTGHELKALNGNTVAVKFVAFSPDGTTLASGDIDGAIKLWDVTSGYERETLQGLSESMESVAFDPANANALIVRSDHKVDRLWNIETGLDNNLPIASGRYLANVMVQPDGRIVRADNDEGNKIVLRDPRSGDDIGTLVALDENDWAVVDNYGRWDASDGAQKLMYYSLTTPEGYEVINFTQLKERYYEPNLLPKLLGYNKEPLKDVAQFKDILLPPVVEPIEPKDARSTTRQVKVRNRNGGIGRVQVFVNGRESIEDARDGKLKANPNLKEYVLSFDLKKAPVVPGQKPDIRVVAWNYDPKAKERYQGYISSRGAEILYQPLAEQIEPPTLYAIIGGVSDYKGDDLDLRFAAKDAEDIYKAIQVGGKNLFGVERLKLKLLSTGGNKDALLPTKENFRQAFAEFAKEAKPNDILFVYLAGHGITLNLGSDTYYYLTQEATTTNKETISKDSSLLASSTINSEELTQWHKSVKAHKQVLILDTCAAGALGGEFKIAEKRELSSDAKRAIEKMRDRVSFHVLMGSAADSVSYEANQYGQGLLTYSLLQGMKGAALQPDGRVDVSKLFNYAADTVPTLAKNIGGIQRPEIRVPIGGTSFSFGLIQSDDDKKLIPLASVKPIVLRPNFQNQEGFKDNLKVGNLLTNRLREINYAEVRGNAGEGLVFVDTDEMPDAILPVGRYVVDGEVVRAAIKLFKNEQTSATLTVEGNLKRMPEFIEAILRAIDIESQKWNSIDRR